MHKVQLIIKLLLQLGIIIVITYIGTEIQKIFHLPLAGSIVGLFLFYLLLQFKIVPLTWVEELQTFIKDDGLFLHTVSCRYYGCCFRNYAKLYTLFRSHYHRNMYRCIIFSEAAHETKDSFPR